MPSLAKDSLNLQDVSQKAEVAKQSLQGIGSQPGIVNLGNDFGKLSFDLQKAGIAAQQNQNGFRNAKLQVDQYGDAVRNAASQQSQMQQTVPFKPGGT